MTGAAPTPDRRLEAKGAFAAPARPAEHCEPDQVPSVDAPPTEVVEAVLLRHPHVRDAAAVVLPHNALGATIGVLLVLDDDGSVEDVTDHARQALPEGLHPHPVARVRELPRTFDGRFNTARAQALLRDVAHLTPSAPVVHHRRVGTRNVWDHLARLAEDEQNLLAEVFRALHNDPGLEQRVNEALGYPNWPMPLTCLPDLAPELAASDPDLDSYFQLSQMATEDLLRIVDRYGWPRARRDGAHVADAAWLLLQHADRENQAREDALAAVAQAVALGHTDPRHLALLHDRTRSVMEEEQIFGTFMLAVDGQPRFLYPTQPLEQIERQRAAISMPSLSKDIPAASTPLLPYGRSRRSSTNPSRPPREAPAVPDSGASASFPCPVPHGAAPVYLAGSVQHRDVLRDLRTRMTPPLHSTARWLDLDAGHRVVSQFDAGVAADRVNAELRVEDIRRSRLLIAVQDDARSPLVCGEAGVALGVQIPVLLVGASTSEIAAHSGIALARDADAALEAAMVWATG
ncbi:hypothetical protein ABZ896_11360 [Streptomyces sp. NPDC047072]|uniref:AMP-binding enzyme n=1 Tax=Streptomyces sp. NPDC047072 TaxID=3154809 RepID=UPI0033E9D94D